MQSQPGLSNIQVYHQKGIFDSSERMLLSGKRKDFQVKCNKALINCILQRDEFSNNVKLKTDAVRLEASFTCLALEKYFKLSNIDRWLKDTNKADLLGSILALNQALLDLNIFLTPIDNMTYTSLVEKPRCYVCLLDAGWTVVRLVSNVWFLLDARASAPQPITQTYLHLLIKQLIVDNEPVFRVSGSGFSAGTVAAPRGGGPALPEGGRPAEPKPPDLSLGRFYLRPYTSYTSHSERREDVINLLTELSRLSFEERSITSSSANGRRVRSRSETRRGFLRLARSQRPEAAGVDSEWPPLEQGGGRRRGSRAKSTPRSAAPQVYHPPRASNHGPDRADEGKASDKRVGKGGEGRPCCICLDGSPDTVLYPCGHQCICRDCQRPFRETFQRCPVCNQPVSDLIRVYQV